MLTADRAIRGSGSTGKEASHIDALTLGICELAQQHRD